MRRTFHLVPEPVWSVAGSDLANGGRYAAASLAAEGFIHCTDGVNVLATTFDRFYADDPRPFVALTVDLDALDVPWRIDEPGSPFPHIYGSIGAIAIRAVAAVRRRDDGRFAGLEPPG